MAHAGPPSTHHVNDSPLNPEEPEKVLERNAGTTGQDQSVGQARLDEFSSAHVPHDGAERPRPLKEARPVAVALTPELSVPSERVAEGVGWLRGSTG